MSKITFAEDAWEEYLYWQTQDKKTLKKINPYFDFQGDRFWLPCSLTLIL